MRTRMMKTARRRVVVPMLALALPAALLAACASGPARRIPAPCPYPATCGSTCSNYPFEPTECWTTKHGPARANVIIGATLQSTNMLYCRDGSYALCFFSGPAQRTGTNSQNRPLPCIVEGRVANCTCQVYTSGPTSGPYFVDINSILNLGAYYETVLACGRDGEGCANIVNCGRDGSVEGCDRQKPAPVCRYVRNQNPDNPTVSLVPKADLISAFSFAMDDDYDLGSTPCQGLYAGCMTAPCFFPEGASQPPTDGDPIQCECPTFAGDFQVGQSGQDCEPPSENVDAHVWSAANSVPDDGGR